MSKTGTGEPIHPWLRASIRPVKVLETKVAK